MSVTPRLALQFAKPFYCSNSIKSSVLVGYAAIDGDPSWILPLAEYFSCDPSGANSGATAIDLYGLNN